MKIRIIGSLIVLAILAILGVVTGVFEDTKPIQPHQHPANASDADFKGLKIN